MVTEVLLMTISFPDFMIDIVPRLSRPRHTFRSVTNGLAASNRSKPRPVETTRCDQPLHRCPATAPLQCLTFPPIRIRASGCTDAYARGRGVRCIWRKGLSKDVAGIFRRVPGDTRAKAPRTRTEDQTDPSVDCRSATINFASLLVTV
jgi:hypothetical protein